MHDPAIDITTMAISVALDERDRYTSRHCSRVAGLSVELGRQCGLAEHELQLLRIAAGFHDVGKIGIPDSVLMKAGPFDSEDWVVMKTHPARGQRIVLAAGLKDCERVGLAVRHHHERYDGGGYPDGIAGDGIPILSRIVALADTYDAMAAARSYARVQTHLQIMEVLQQEQGRQHDPYLLAKLVTLIEHSKFRNAS